MNKTTLFFITLPLFMGLSHASVASDSPKTLYCPEQIECLKNQSTSFCKVIGDNTASWSAVNALVRPIKKGTYLFSSATGRYQSTYQTLSCHYTLPGDSSEIYISYKDKQFQWEPDSKDTSGWHIWREDYGICRDSSPKNCPFQPVPLVKIIRDNNLDRSNIEAYANGILIDKHYSFYSGPQMINMYKAWDACSDSGLCTINLMVSVYGTAVDAGSLEVDMDNQMKIVQIHSDPSTGFKILSTEDPNTIKISKENKSIMDKVRRQFNF